ncbi:MAG: ABC transporter permease [Planctomycetota bacterium]|uniref:MlaE family ABC transporter permease n=1 Tax=uncultured Gimesia sp. TaxID=1678688 RepID=UPI0034530905
MGDLFLFGWEMVGWMITRLPPRSNLWLCMYHIGIQSIPVILITGGFIGMVLAVQSYDQFKLMHMENQIGAVISISLVEELGPVLAAIMLAGRVGTSMSAELGTMRVTEQIDALRALGADPVHYLVVPRFLSCCLLIPLLTVIADAVGILGGWFFSTQVLGVDSFYYWHYSKNFVFAYDVLGGIFKSFFFGAAISLISCHRGFHCGAGAEGVGKAATEAFVYSFIVIMFLDFMLGVTIVNFYHFMQSVYPGVIR